MKIILYLFSVSIIQYGCILSENEQCTEERIVTPGDNIIKRVFLYQDCSDSSNYAYSEYWKDKIHHRGEVVNGYKQGEWNYYNLLSGKRNLIEVFVNDSVVETKSLFQRTQTVKSHSVVINDTIAVQTNYYQNQKIKSKGQLKIGRNRIGSERIGTWLEYDSIEPYVFEGNYDGYKPDTIVEVDSLTGEMVVIISMSTPRVGTWTKADLQTGVIDTLDYENKDKP